VQLELDLHEYKYNMTNIAQLMKKPSGKARKAHRKPTDTTNIDPRECQPIPDVDIQPPRHYSLPERRIWQELATQLRGKLQPIDSPAFEMLVELTLRQRNRGEFTASERAAMLKLFDQFHMTPKARQRSDDKMDQSSGDNPFAKI
jgi:hypothetical protein